MKADGVGGARSRGNICDHRQELFSLRA
jgi:hypothetical protein